MDMTDQAFFKYVRNFSQYQKRSMFGGIGLFCDDAMFALVSNDCCYLRGGNELDEELMQLNCEKYKHVKRQTTATVNYYDVTELFESGFSGLDELLKKSIEYSVKERKYQKSSASRRLRDLPNMQLTLERMVKKAGVDDVEAFLELGPVEVFNKVRQAYGNDVDVKLLWKFAGAIDGVHWKLIQEPRKKQLLELCN
ncbi:MULTISPECIES: TfoX/Sxy family DNA transformation protein [Vibrio]|jgi:DNA transformation protein|uniref:DNA transformation protein n=1 Tax=Vibrio natriegens NBRC 15636 = ATCC 14048 = DSM 759 TaxID=1219067 RepID=A0AAN0Y1X7_VIBNA|nr:MULTISPECIES: TfoX/Sxy family DNA transformation protein [Vibrio]MBR9789755.1 TfoX/Sxy family DNA transformation protein [Vibrionaceae bacterium]MEE3878176.1 TfoX/Sxy family DNA transformation protein [Vibrio sp. YYF0003]WMN88378.1 TfoX/Sxy family DNA transformation protein [Vibrio parahaemolyticus]AEX21693.1 DNA transformation protein TfoX [Vibrio sp. EJY3]ALR15815.1 DNA transformation protein [Vibrio natriegens NBRC 15636 = ATCC 14048 = DSM 759]